MKKSDFVHRTFAFLLTSVLATGLLTTSKSHASENTGEALAPIESTNLQVRPSGWSSQAAVSGVTETSLFDLNWETPGFFSNALNLRIGAGFGTHRRSDEEVYFYSLQAGLKWTLARASSAGLMPYVFLGYRSLRPYGDSRPVGAVGDATNGISGSVETLLGATWNHTARPTESIEIRGGVFVEGGTSRSNFRAQPSSANARIADGFLIRLGFLRYL